MAELSLQDSFSNQGDPDSRLHWGSVIAWIAASPFVTIVPLFIFNIGLSSLVGGGNLTETANIRLFSQVRRSSTAGRGSHRS